MAILLESIFIMIRKHLDFALTSKIDEDGVINFTNNMDNDIIHVDKTSLEDLIEFQKASFEIIAGYYFNEGRNGAINHVIEYLYNLRLKLKKIRIQHRWLLNCL